VALIAGVLVAKYAALRAAVPLATAASARILK